MRNVSDEISGENQNTHIRFHNIFFFKFVPFVRQRGNVLQIRAGHRLKYGACGLHAGYLWLQARTPFFSTATKVALTSINVTL